MNPSILALVFLFLSFPAIAQTTKRDDDPLKNLERLVLTSEKARLNVRREYDRFEDRTRYWTVPLPVLIDGRADQSLMVSSFFQFRGSGAGHSIERLGFVFFSNSPEFRFVRYSQLYVIVDGQRIDPESPVSNERDVQETTARETLEFSVPYKSLIQIAHASHVELRLGSTEFELTETNLSDLKALLAKIKVVKVK